MFILVGVLLDLGDGFYLYIFGCLVVGEMSYRNKRRDGWLYLFLFCILVLEDL